MDTGVEHRTSQTALGVHVGGRGVRDTGVVEMMDGGK